MTNVPLRNFSGGEIAPSLYGRCDLAKYLTSMRQMRNFIAMRHGGATMRPGFEYVYPVFDANTKGRILPFVSSDLDADKYAIEFGDLVVRFYQNGAPVSVVGAPAWITATAYTAGQVVSETGKYYYCKTAHTSGAGSTPGTGTSWQTYWYVMSGTVLEIPSPYAAADLFGLQYAQAHQTMSFVHGSYAPYVLTRVSATAPQQWTFQPIVFGPAIGTPGGFIIASGGSAGAQYWWAVTAVDGTTGEESLAAIVTASGKVPSAGTPTLLAWDLVTGADHYNIYRSTDGATYGYVDSINGVNLAPSTFSTWTVSSSVITGSVVGSWQMAGASAQSQPLTATPALKASDGVYSIEGFLTVSMAGSTPLTRTKGRIHVFYSRDGETPVDAGVLGVDSGYLLNDGTLGPTFMSGTITVPDNGYGSLVFQLYAEMYITTTGIAGTGTVTVDESVGGSNVITWTSGGVTFSDVAAAADMTQQPPKDLNYFKKAGDYPTAVTRYQQRQIFANTNNNPGYIFASRTASPGNFTQETPILPASSFSFELDSNKAVIVRHLLDLERLIVFTSAEEKILEGEYASGILKPDTLNPRTYTGNGSAAVEPLLASAIALYVQARGSQVRMVKYGSQAVNADLTLLADHLIRRRQIVDWAYAFTPDSIVWAVRDDGTLLGLTFLSDQEVWGWHRHDTQGVFESVCTVPEGTEDRLYAIVQRTINGVTARYVERLALSNVKDVTDVRDSIYSDCSILAYDGRNTDTTNTVVLSGGTTWETSEVLTLTAEKSVFSAGDVGKTFLLINDSTGERMYFVITAYTSGTVIKGMGEVIVPESLRGVATADWARCASSVSGLGALEGEKVSVLADGFVLSSPNNPNYAVAMAVSAGALAFSHPYSVIRVGLPYFGDMETLDIDTPTPTRKNKKSLVSRVILYLENSASLWAGLFQNVSDAAPLNLMEELKLRDDEDYSNPTSLVTDSRDIVIDSSHNTNGRVFLRQVDPLPTTVLMIAPSFADE